MAYLNSLIPLLLFFTSLFSFIAYAQNPSDASKSLNHDANAHSTQIKHTSSSDFSEFKVVYAVSSKARIYHLFLDCHHLRAARHKSRVIAHDIRDVKGKMRPCKSCGDKAMVSSGKKAKKQSKKSSRQRYRDSDNPPHRRYLDEPADDF